MKHSHAILAALFAVSCTMPLERTPLDIAEPRAGDRWTYQKLNAYNGNPKGETDYQVLAVEGDSMRLQADTLPANLYPLRWSQFELADGRQFVYPVPQGGRESVVSFSSDTAQSVRVAVYSRVSGWETIKVPAGSFDALKVSRNIYVDDREWYKSQTRVRQFEWYAPAIATPVKVESQASYRDLRRSYDVVIEGEWNRWVLTEYSSAERE